MKAQLEDCIDRLTMEIECFPWSEQDVYVDWLAQTYYYVRHSTRLLAAAAARCPYDEQGNTVHYRFAKHMDEEKKHEILALHDLKELGASIDRLPEHHSTRLFYEPQYYKIEHQNPIIIFGYIIPLEAIAVAQGQRVLEAAMHAFGNKCVSFLRVHVQDDVDHLDKALCALQNVSDDARLLIEENMQQSTYCYSLMLSDIRRQLESSTLGDY
jgi:pyrroloquinoline quinone (PQQ) biosynthesis protein C